MGTNNPLKGATMLGPTEAVCRTCNMEFFGGGVVPEEGYECERCKQAALDYANKRLERLAYE